MFFNAHKKSLVDLVIYLPPFLQIVAEMVADIYVITSPNRPGLSDFTLKKKGRPLYKAS